ncbi:spore protein [Clostridiales bacterium PH28_bin88]|nr:spore protein [Clostridiales bacterium PH28_bin88]
MAQGQQGKAQLVPAAHQALDNLKYEIAAEIGLPVKQGSEDYWGELTSRDCGAVGGNMVRRMIAFAEQHLAGAPQATV